MPSIKMEDYCVIGAGLIGTAVAKYLSRSSSAVSLVGSKEPRRETYSQNEIFGAHYDEGRITRNLDSHPVWSHFAQKSISQYRTIEQESGVKFFTENGYAVFADVDSNLLSETLKVADRYGIAADYVDSAALTRNFPYLNPPEKMAALHEKRQSGTINPRKLRDAQILIATANGCRVVEDIAKEIHRKGDHFEVTLANCNRQIRAKRIILCPGAFISHNKLLPPGITLDLQFRSVVVCRIKCDAAIRQKLASMPCVSFASARNFGSYRGDEGLSFYMMPPIQYSDGNYYLKLGYSEDFRKHYFTRPSEITNWYRSADTEMAELLASDAKHFIPGLNVSQYEVDHCAITLTPTELPYIGEAYPGVFVAVGCHGYAAKSSDEIGRLLAVLASEGRWDCSEFSADMFQCRYLNSKSTL